MEDTVQSTPAHEPGEIELLKLALAESKEHLARAEEQLAKAKNAERILEQITTTVQDFAIILLTREGRIELWNEGAERLLGYTDKQIHGQDARILFTEEDQGNQLPEKELETARSLGRAAEDCMLMRKDGSRFWASGVTTAIRGGDGSLQGFVKILRDRTAQKTLEEELRRVNTTLETRIRERTEDLEDALKEMAAFSYSIAHDLRAPLRAMTGFAQVLSEECSQELGEEGRDYAAKISEAARKMNQMIDDLLTYSRLTRTDILCHPLNPEVVLDLVLRRLGSEIRQKDAQVTVVRPLPIVLAHEITLEQVLINLISNALKFVAPGVKPQIRIWGEEHPEWMRISVEDNGIGIPPEYRKKIFEIFERLHPEGNYPGTGIGLAIVNRAVERMRGRVGVEAARSGTGSCFWVELRKVATP
jgi:PAS domain S-box-containing protein